MVMKVLMPALSPTMTEGTVSKWVKSVGDRVEPGDVIAEIETDKAVMEVESVDAGYLGKVYISAGTNNVSVGTLIAAIVENMTDVEKLTDDLTSTTSTPKNIASSEVKVANAPSHMLTEDVARERRFVSPAARKIAQENNVDLMPIVGTGPRGRIVKHDIVSLIGNEPKTANTISAQPQQIKSVTKSAVYSDNPHKIIPLNNMRKTIAQRLVESKQSVPHFYLTIECNIDKLQLLRGEVNAASNMKVSVNDFVIKACALAIQDVPNVNASWNDNGIVVYERIDISVAVAIDNGLITPIIFDTPNKGLVSISKEMKDLATRAKDFKLMPHEYQGGTFCISNLGMYGIKNFNAIINPPQSAILAVGAAIKKPIVKADDSIEVASIMEITLSCDHRVIDGALAATLLQKVKQYIENPMLILV